MKPIIFRQDGDWVAGHIGPFSFEIRRSAKHTGFGIDEGRINKLWLSWKDSYGTVAAFDRGWDRLPAFRKAQEAVDTLCALWN